MASRSEDPRCEYPFQAQLLSECPRPSDQLTRWIEAPAHRLEISTGREDGSLEPAVTRSPLMDLLDPLKGRVDWHGAMQYGEQHILVTLHLLRTVSGLVRVARGSFKTFDCQCGLPRQRRSTAARFSARASPASSWSSSNTPIAASSSLVASR